MKPVYFIILWENPLAYFFLSNLIKNIHNEYNVHLFYLDNFKESKLNPENLKIIKDTNIYKLNKRNNFFDKFLYLYFILKISFLIFLKKPKFIYMINRYAVYPNIIYYFLSRAKKIYHNLDYDHPRNIYQKILKVIEKWSFSLCNVIIASHPKRLVFFKTNKKIKKIAFYNCVLKQNFIKRKLIKKMKKKNVFYFGSIGPGHALDKLIASVDHLPKNVKIIIYGWIVDRQHYEDLKKKAKTLINRKNIIFKIDVKNNHWQNKLFQSDIGVALYEPINISHKYMVGASQKINIFLSANLPILTSDNRDSLSFEKKYKCSKSVNIRNPISIAKGINFLLKKKNYNRLKKFAQKAYQNEFNFEKQFSKIKKFIY